MRAILLSLLLMYGFILVGWVLGWSNFSVGAQAYSLGSVAKTLGWLALFAIATHGLLSLPLTAWVLRAYRGKLNRPLRLIVGTFLISIPLLSFSYFCARGPGLFEWVDYLVLVIPSAVIAMLIYEMTARPGMITWYLCATVFFQLFILQDQLAPFTVWVNWGANSVYLYDLKMVFAGIGVLWMIYYQQFRFQRMR